MKNISKLFKKDVETLKTVSSQLEFVNVIEEDAEELNELSNTLKKAVANIERQLASIENAAFNKAISRNLSINKK